MCCDGCNRKSSKRCARRQGRRERCAQRREERREGCAQRRRERWEPSKLRLRLRQFKIAQGVFILAYYLLILLSGALSHGRGIGTVLHILTCMTLILTSWTLIFSIWGSKSKVALALSITGDSISLALQLLAVIAVFVARPSQRCFTGHFGRSGPSCGAVWLSLIVSNILLASFIHTIVRAAVLISALECESRQRLPVSIQDSTPDSPRDSTATEQPPSYAASEATLPAYPDAETLRLDEEAATNRKGGAQNTSVASSSTLSEPAATPRSSEDSDSDDGREDRPLLHF